MLLKKGLKIGLIVVTSVVTMGPTEGADNGPLEPDEDKALAQANAANQDALLLDKALTKGAVRVIVKLRQNFQSEGQLAGMQAIRSQRSTTARLQDNVMSALAGHSVAFIKRYKYVPYMAMEVDAAALQALRSLSEVVEITEDIAVPATLIKSVPLIGADMAWVAGYLGAGWSVAILDSGVDKTHPFLAGKVVAEACFSGYSSASGVKSLCPNGQKEQYGGGAGVNCQLSGCDHGTHVAGIAAGKGSSFSGVAGDASIIAVQVFSRFDNVQDCDPEPAPCIRSFTSDQMSGLEFVYELGNQFKTAAVNMSLGGGSYTSACDNDPRKPYIDNLRSVGIATVISSGNNYNPAGIGSPACISSAISVGATDEHDQVADFSQSAPFLSLLAPGVAITSAVPGGGYGSKQGTSMAAPHVTGAWAILKSKKPAADVSEILSALVSTGWPAADYRNSIIKPRIQVDAALDYIGTGPRSNSDLVVDFGTTDGIWVRYDSGTWVKLHNASARQVVAADVDNNGRGDLVVDFGSSNGIWVRYDSGTWVKLHNASARQVVAADVDNNGRGDLVVDFGSSNGIWVRYDSGTWVKLHNASARQIIAVDIDKNSRSDLVVDFGTTNGIRVRLDNGSWAQVHNLSAKQMVAVDIDKNGWSDLVVDFGTTNGIQVRLDNGSWAQVHNLSAKQMVAADVNKNGRADLVVDFGPGVGIWVRLNGSNWDQLHPASAREVIAADIDGK